MPRKKKAPSEFTQDSKRFCPECDEDIVLSFGGEANWVTHLNGEKHKRKAAKVNKVDIQKKKTNILNFFSKVTATTAGPSTTLPGPQPLTSRLGLSTGSVLGPIASGSRIRGAVVDLTSDDDASSADFNSPLLQRLRRSMATLPNTIPVGTPDGPLARFSGSPKHELSEDDEDPWQPLDRALNNVLGYETTAEDIARLVCRGPYGLDGLVQWLDSCVSDLGISESLLEGKVQRVIDGISLCAQPLTVSSNEPDYGSPRAVYTLSSPATSRPSSPASSRPSSPPVSRPSSPPISVPSSPMASAPLSLPASPLLRAAYSDQGRPGPSLSTRTCPGYHFETPDNEPCLMSWPAALETRHPSVPWELRVTGNKIYLRSVKCSGSVPNPQQSACTFCELLHSNTIVMGIRHRNMEGVHEKTNWPYLTLSHTFDRIGRLNKTVDSMRFNALNYARKELRRAAQFDGWKRVVQAIAGADVPRMRTALEVALNAGSGFRGVLNMIDRAVRHIYHPKSYEEQEFQKTFLIWKLGGATAAAIANRTLGLPSQEVTRRRILVKPTRASSLFPTLPELYHNLANSFGGLGAPPGGVVLPLSLPIDEIKVQERLRWEASTNLIHGLCREHSGHCVVEFHGMDQADYILSELQSHNIHFASEATVAATCVLTKDPRSYVARPFLISGTCKQEDESQHTNLLKTALKAIKTSTSVSSQYRLYCVATDGESRRRRALLNITYRHPLSPTSPIYSKLDPLRLFNKVCGDDDLTIDFDYRHNLKRLRNTLIRTNGVRIDGVLITPAVLKHHLMLDGMSEVGVDRLLNPKDKQDVPLTYRLLYSISRLPPSDDPTLRSVRRILRLLGAFYRNLLDPYTDIKMSLQEQLTQLSSAVHLSLAMYARDKGNFLPYQSFHDIAWMVKNAFFCVAKAQTDNPDGDFFLTSLGTNALEGVFGKVRTMLGSDTNADMIQLSNRIDAAVQAENILQIHPDWAPEARRLKLKALAEEDDESASSHDHVGPRSWTGNTLVHTVILRTAWDRGRQLAEQTLKAANISVPFADMDRGDGYDILCPFGGNKAVLISGVLRTGEREEEEDELDLPTADAEATTTTEDDADLDSGNLLDFDDLAELEAAKLTNDQAPLSNADTGLPSSSIYGSDSTSGTRQPVPPALASPFVQIPGTSKLQHKGTVCRILSSPFTIQDSKDRLKRVRGLAQYNEQLTTSLYGTKTLADGEENAPALVMVEDPAVTLVRCNQMVFVAVIQLKGIRLSGANMQTLPLVQLQEPNVRLRGQIMALVPCGDEESHQPNGPDWEWNGLYAPGNDLDDIPGIFVEPINPTLQPASCKELNGSQTIAIRTSELRAIGLLVYERSRGSLAQLRTTPISAAFPYTTRNTGEACFVCEADSDSRATQPDHERCICCNLRTVDFSVPALLRHMGAHILYDPRLKDVQDPCGWCLRSGPGCAVYIRKNGRGGYQLDPDLSRCQSGVRVFSLKPASEFNDRSFCTNHPLLCPLCPKGSPAVWKYNLLAHFRSFHTVRKLDLYEDLFEITPKERELMELEYGKKHRVNKSAKKPRKTLKISEAHSTRVALRATTSFHPSSLGDINETDHDESESESDAGGGNSKADGKSNTEPHFVSVEDSDGLAIHGNDSPDPTTDLEKLPSPSPSPRRRTSLEPVTSDDGGQPDVPSTTSTSSLVLSLVTPSVEDNPEQPIASSSRPRRNKRKVQDAAAASDINASEPMYCCDPECGLLCVDKNTYVRCDGPACTDTFHLACIGLFTKPDEGWFCDDECRANAGYRVTKRRRR